MSVLTQINKMAVRLQPDGIKTEPPLHASRGCSWGAGVGGHGLSERSEPYLDTPIGTSQGQVFEGSTAQYIEECRIRKRAKHIVKVMYALNQCGRRDQALALISCGKWFRRVDFPCGTYRLVPIHCDSPFCPECCARRSKPLLKRVAEKIRQSDHDYWHMTVTRKNWLCLTSKAVSELIKQFAKLRDTETWREYVTGGLRSVECIWSEDTAWHPHFHVLIETPKRLPMDWIFKLQAQWKRITGDSHVINLEKMYGLDKKGKKTRKVNMRGLREIVKYSTKAADFAHRPDLVDSFLQAFENVRRVQAFGSFIGALSEEKSAPEDQEPVGCACGKCHWSDGKMCGPEYHVTETVIGPGEIRQLRLFDSGHDPPMAYPSDWIYADTYARREAEASNAAQFELPGISPQ